MLKLVHSGTSEPSDARKTRLSALHAIRYGETAERILVSAHGDPVASEIAALREQGVGADEAKRMLAERGAALRQALGRT